MAFVVCDDVVLSRYISRLQEIIVDNNGFIHNQIKILAQGDMLSIESHSKHEENKPIIIIPSNLLLTLDDYNLNLDADEIVIESYRPDITSDSRELMQLMINIYNHTNKISCQRKIDSSLTYLITTEFYTQITRGRDKIYMTLVQDELNNDLKSHLLNNYLKTRALDFKPSDDEIRKVLMPIADCLNNHPESPPISGMENEHGQRSLVIFQSNPLPGSIECFVRYGVLDAIELFLIYHYVDENSFFARSINLDIELPSLGHIRIYSTTEKPDLNCIPDYLKDLNLYFPQIRADISKYYVETSFLMIPQSQAPLSMRRIITYMIHMLNPDLDVNAVNRFMMQVERIILQENIRHYTELMKYLDNYKPNKSLSLIHVMAMRAVRIHLDNIYKYPLLGNN